jgi:hypothetical protein
MQIPWSGSSLVSLSLKFPVGILVSAVIGRILAPDWVNRVINKIGVWLS